MRGSGGDVELIANGLGQGLWHRIQYHEAKYGSWISGDAVSGMQKQQSRHRIDGLEKAGTAGRE